MSDDVNQKLRRCLGAAAMFAAVTGLGMTGPEGQHMGAAAQLPVEGHLPSLGGATGWLNSQPLTPSDLRGRVVLIDIWTYTCINWLRTLPYVRAWAEKYKDQGLIVIGVHTPEFPFEKDVDNIRRAAKAMRIGYPIAIDSDYAIWRALKNQYWPALYIVDAQGRIRHHHFGEGEYEMSERVIQRLLAEAGGGRSHGLVSVDARGIEVAADWDNLMSGENYVGYERTENFSSPGGSARDQSHPYTVPAMLGLNHWAVGRLDDGKGSPGARQAQRAHRLPLSCPRPPPRHGAAGKRHLRAVSRVDRWTSARPCSRGGRGRRWKRHLERAADLSADPAACSHHGSNI